MAREKTGDQRRRERLRHYRREYVRLKTRLREIGFICEGTLVERWMQCGKPNCACATDRASRHGPYYQLSWKEKGKTVPRRQRPKSPDFSRFSRCQKVATPISIG